MVKLSAGALLEKRLAQSMGLDKYAEIRKAAIENDVSKDAEFQHAFNAFYRVRRNEAWRKTYYSLFQQAKEKHYSFADVINALYETTGNVEASFSSKMIATIDPEKPIWDQYVLQNLGLELKGKTSRDKVKQAIVIYAQIEKWYQEYLVTEEARENIAEFDRWLPSYSWIPAIKKIDYPLWSKRDEDRYEFT